jgi:hypothetical protein
MSTTTSLRGRLAEFRALRHEIEANVLALATSVDGRRFTFQAPLEPLELRAGGYVELETPAGRWLGQLLSLEITRIDAAEASWAGEAAFSSHVIARLATGEGTVLSGPPVPFHDAALRPAAPAAVRAWLHETAPARAILPAGELRLAPGSTFGLDAGGFNRHTFLCGQSGSGKTYALGVLVERLLLETGLRMVILDPNSDFTRLAEVRDGVDRELGRRFRNATTALEVHRSTATGDERLRVRLSELGRSAQAAMLRLDPIADREEYSELVTLLDETTPDRLEDLHRIARPGVEALATRARNLAVDSWDVWARDDAGSTLEALDDPAVRCLVIDLGSLPTPEEQALVAGAVLERLWRRRTRREPMLIVIDEAHNVCPAQPEDGLTAIATEYAVRIAAEGRKFGLYLLASTQRPQKVHANVVSQCDNLVLMRMNSAADLAYTGEIFSFVHPGLLAQSGAFGLGEALVAGKVSSHPALIKVGGRIAEEGGADVPATWAAPRPGG